MVARVVVVDGAAEVEGGGMVVAELWEVVTAGVVVVAAPAMVVVTGRVVATAPAVVVVDGGVPVEDVVPAGSAVLLAASAGMVTDDGGAAVSDSGEVERSPFNPVSDVHATANSNKSPHQSPGRLRPGICGSSGVQRHRASP